MRFKVSKRLIDKCKYVKVHCWNMKMDKKKLKLNVEMGSYYRLWDENENIMAVFENMKKVTIFEGWV